MKLGVTIARLRKAKNLTQKDIPGVSSVTLSQVETGKVSPTVNTLAKIADALGVSVPVLFLEASEPIDGVFIWVFQERLHHHEAQ